jgi:D-3-phosphoglycerate dehydrogenase
VSQRVLIGCPHLQRELPKYAGRFQDRGIEVEAPPVRQQLSESFLLQNIERFDGVVAGVEPFTAAVLERGRRLRVIAKWGIGTDNIDRAAAESRGIVVMNTPGQLSDEVADVVIGYMVMLARRLHKIDAAVRGGDWAQVRGESLGGKTLGIVGLGAIGRAVARRALAMGMEVAGHDPFLDAETAATFGAASVPLRLLLEQAHFVSLNCNLTPENHHLLGREQFAGMRPGAYLINTSRGGLIDESALVEALENGTLAGAALDVFESEPLPPASPLRRFEQVILGSHNCSNTAEAVARINEMAVQNLLGILQQAA